MSLAVYVFQDANRNQITIDSNDYNYTGTWSAYGSYHSSTLDTADYGNGRYITIIDNVGANPLYVPPRNQPKKWSPLAKIIAGDEPPYPPTPSGTATVDQLFMMGTNALYAAWAGTYLAGKAYDLASIGTNVGTNAYNLATTANAEAASAIDLANQALQTAWIGTNATGATALAYTALTTAWSGTSGANAAYALAVTGTNAATGAISLANTAVTTSWAGTNAIPLANQGITQSWAGTNAIDLANQALQTAWLGTNATGATTLAYTALTTAWTGTRTADSAYSVAVTGTNAAASGIDLANKALQTAWLGTNATGATNLAYTALQTAWTGTAEATAAIVLANQGITQSWAGTNAIVLANQGITSAWAGTSAIALANQGITQSWAGTNAIVLANQGITQSWAGTNAIALANQAFVLAEAGTVIPPLSTLPDVNIPSPTAQQVLTYDGSKWVATSPSSTTSAVGFTLDSTAAGTGTYSTLSVVPVGGAEQTDALTLTAADGEKPFATAYLSGTLNRTLIDAGIWEFNTYVTAVPYTGTTSTQVIAKVFRRASSGAETPLFSATSDPIGSLDPELTSTIAVQGTFTASLSDKIVAKYYGQTNDVGVVTLNVFHNGTAHYSHFHTPLSSKHNDLAGLQGGTFNEYYHLTQSQAASVVSLIAAGTAVVGSPTVDIGLSMIPGSGSIAMRADSAPALNTSILPTWQGQHAFNKGLRLPQSGLVVNLTSSTITTLFTTDRSAIRFSSNSLVPSDRRFVLEAGNSDGQILIMECVSGRAELLDNSSSSGCYTRLQTHWRPGANETLTLRYNGSEWIELGRSPVPAPLVETQAIAWNGTVIIDMTGSQYQTLNLGGSTFFTAANYGTALAVALDITGTGSFALSYDSAWQQLTPLASALNSGATGVLELVSFGTTASQAVVSYSATDYRPTTAAAQSDTLAYTALTTAWTGTSAAAAGIGLANQALATAFTGTANAATANSLAYTALTTAWVGTNSGQSAYNLAAIGTNVGTNALTNAATANALAYTALTTAWVGTNNTGQASLPLVGGTLTGIMVAPNVYFGSAAESARSGTIEVNFKTGAYHTATLNGSVTVSGTNYGPGRGAALILTGGTVSSPIYFNPSFVFLGTAPTSLGASQIGIVSLTSLGDQPANTLAIYTATDVASVGASTTVTNIGTGAGLVYAQTVANAVQLRTITAGANVTVVNGASAIVISSTSSGTSATATTLVNIGTGAGQVYAQAVAGTAQLRTITAGANVTVVNGASDIVISSTSSGTSSSGATDILQVQVFN